MMVIEACRPVRPRPAPPAARPRRARERRVVLRARLRFSRRDGPRAARGRRRAARRLRPRREGLRAAPRGRRARASRRAACRACASRRSSDQAHRELAVRARAHAEALLDDRGARRRTSTPSRRELEAGWLAARSRVPASAAEAAPEPPMADAGRVIAGTARGLRLVAPGRGDAAAGRPRQADPVRDPRAGPARAPRSWTCSRAAARPASRRSRAAPRRRRSSSATGPRHGHRREPRADPSRRPGRAGRDRGCPRLAGVTATGGASAPFDLVIVDPPYAEPAYSRGLALGGAAGTAPRRRRPGRSPSTSGETAAARTVGLLASERERRFGETTLTFYRRAEEDR